MKGCKYNVIIQYLDYLQIKISCTCNFTYSQWPLCIYVCRAETKAKKSVRNTQNLTAAVKKPQVIVRLSVTVDESSQVKSS